MPISKTYGTSINLQTYVDVKKIALIDMALGHKYDVHPSSNSDFVKTLVEIFIQSLGLSEDSISIEDSITWLNERGYSLKQIIKKEEKKLPSINLPDLNLGKANTKIPTKIDFDSDLLKDLPPDERERAIMRLNKIEKEKEN